MVGGRVLVIGHDHVAGLGHLGPALASRGMRPELVTVVPRERFRRPDVELDLPGVRAFEGVVVLGAPWPRSAIERWAGPERDYLRSAHEAGVGLLGICFGAQLISEALGGRTEPLEASRIGWGSVFSATPRLSRGPWFQWHADRLLPPPGAVELARSADGCEAFAVGRSLGVQFHPEMSSALLRDWLDVPGGGGLGPRRARALAEATDQNERSGLADRVGSFADLVVARWRQD